MKLRIAVIYGGRSGEHEVSVRSARAILDALDPACYERIEYFIDQQGAHPDIDVVFPVLHGAFGEDGAVQGLLEFADLPYVGAGVMASSVCARLPFPMFVTPANLGSSVGISKAHDRAELVAAIAFAKQYDRKVIVERGIVGRELECSVLGRFPALRDPPSRESHDYDDKCLLDQAKTQLPADLPPDKPTSSAASPSSAKTWAA